MNDALAGIRLRNTVTSQKEEVLGRNDQKKNNAGGFVFEVAGEDRIKRFLTLGTDGGTYYQKEQPYTRENAAVVIDWAKNHGRHLVWLIHDISVKGRAPRQNPALFSLAAVFAFGNDDAKKEAKALFNSIVRTGTHLFTFVKYTEQLRGWGPSVRKAVAGWYTSKDTNDLSYQMIKYRQREDWTHRDVLRSAHPVPVDGEQDALFAWTCGKTGKLFRGGDGMTVLPGWTRAFDLVQGFGKLGPNDSKTAKSVYADVIREYPGLPWEALPDVALSIPETWEALIDQGMPISAMIRQLPRLTNLGLTSGATLHKIVSALTGEELLRKGRVHPVKLLYALKTYAGGHSTGKGKNTWTPAQQIVDALDEAFYTSFGTVEPTGKRVQIAIDCSMSMTWPENMCGVLQAREGAVAMAMATAAVEKDYVVTGFTMDANSTVFSSRRHGEVGLSELPVSPRRRLDDNLHTINNTRAGGTDCSLPMRWAAQNNLEFDTFIVYTDNETWGGEIHPFEALRQYRQSSGIDAKMIVVGMSATEFTIADPTDAGMLDVAGFDADTPQIISGFARGDFS